jgi:predicted amidophosphoribosyltransferase
MSVICEFCGTEIKENQTACSVCGKTIEKMSAPAADECKFVCSGCGKEYPTGTKFCSECGSKVEEKQDETGDDSISRDLWLQKAESECNEKIIEAVEYMKIADLSSPSVEDAEMAAACADLDALKLM